MTLNKEIAICEHYGYQFLKLVDRYELRDKDNKPLTRLYAMSQELAYDVMIDRAVVHYRKNN